IRDPHFNRFAALIRVPTWGHQWKQHYADVPFWTLLGAVRDLTSNEQFASDKTPWLAAFVRLVTAITQADERLFYTEEDVLSLTGLRSIGVAYTMPDDGAGDQAPEQPDDDDDQGAGAQRLMG